MTSKDNIDIFSGHDMHALAEMMNSKNHSDNKYITEYIQKNHSTNANFSFIEEAIENIKNKKIVNKPTIQGMMSSFLISNDKLKEN